MTVTLSEELQNRNFQNEEDIYSVDETEEEICEEIAEEANGVIGEVYSILGMENPHSMTAEDVKELLDEPVKSYEGFSGKALIIEIIKDVFDVDDISKITENSNLYHDLNADHYDYDHAYLLLKLEEQFDIEIPEEDMEKLATVGDIFKYLEYREIQY